MDKLVTLYRFHHQHLHGECLYVLIEDPRTDILVIGCSAHADQPNLVNLVKRVWVKPAQIRMTANKENH